MRPWYVVLLVVCGCGRFGFGFESFGPGDAPPEVVPDAPADGPAPDSAEAALLASAVAHWKFDDGAGLTAIDSTGNGHTLSLVNGPTWTSGIVGGAIRADGLDDYLVTLAPIPLSTTSAITLSLWSKRPYTVGPNHTLVELSTNYNGTSTGFGLFPDDDDVGSCAPVGIYIGVQGNAGYTMNCYAQPTSDVWHHLLVIYDKGKIGSAEVEFFIDGASQTPTGFPYVSDNTNSFGDHPFYVFARGGSFEFNPGDLDEMVIFDRALTPAERALLF